MLVRLRGFVRSLGTTASQTPISFLSNTELSFLSDVLGNWEEGVVTSQSLTETDPSVESAEELVQLFSGYCEQLEMIDSIRKKLGIHVH